ncbi:MAG: hypothetical protein N2260_09580 [Syntrophobacterales bacterium]|nr:hypothetical protein [Syntrophobacterales bacterium]
MNIFDISALIGGVVFLIFSAKYLVEGLIGIAARLAVQPFILAMLIISIDLEEFAPAVIGSYQHLTALSYGSILGTVIFLILLALGSAAFLFPIKHPDFPIKYIWMLGGVIFLIFILSLDGLISRGDGLVTLATYVTFLGYLIRDMRRTRAAKMEIEEAEEEVKKILKRPNWYFPFMFISGLAGLLIGALLVIRGTKAVLYWSGIEETILGFTLLAVSANSVELVEAIIPAKQGHPEVVIGNVVGSSFFQLLFTTGICSLIHPVQVSRAAIQYLIPAVIFCWVVLLTIVWCRQTPRWVGFILILFYIAFAIGTVMLGLRL